MKLFCLAVLTLVFMNVRAESSAQDHNREGAQAPELTVCEVLSHAAQYNGQLVTIKGKTFGTDEGWWLYSDECPGALTTDSYPWPSEIALELPTLRPPQRLHDVAFEYDWGARRRIEAKYERLRKHAPDSCLVSAITGLFETHTEWESAKLTYPNGTWKFAGFGHLGGAPGQLLIKSEDDVVAIPHCQKERAGKIRK